MPAADTVEQGSETEEEDEEGRGNAFQVQRRAPKGNALISPSKKQKKGK